MLLQGSEQVIDAQRPACYQQHTVNTPVAHCAVSRTHALEEATQQQWNQQRCSQLLPSRCTAGTMASASSPKEVPSSPTVQLRREREGPPCKIHRIRCVIPSVWPPRSVAHTHVFRVVHRYGPRTARHALPSSIHASAVGNGRQRSAMHAVPRACSVQCAKPLPSLPPVEPSHRPLSPVPVVLLVSASP